MFRRPARNELDDILELALQLLNLALDALALLLRQSVEGFRLHHRAVRNRREGKPGRRSDQGDVLRLRLLAQRLEGGLLAFAGAVLQRLATVAVILALEGGRYRRAQLVDQGAHRRQIGRAWGRETVCPYV